MTQVCCCVFQERSHHLDQGLREIGRQCKSPLDYYRPDALNPAHSRLWPLGKTNHTHSRTKHKLCDLSVAFPSGEPARFAVISVYLELVVIPCQGAAETWERRRTSEWYWYWNSSFYILSNHAGCCFLPGAVSNEWRPETVSFGGPVFPKLQFLHPECSGRGSMCCRLAS